MAVRRQDALGYQIGLLHRLLDRALEGYLSPFGVLPGQLPTLIMLYEQDGLTQAELCNRINVKQPTMANTLHRMEKSGLIERSKDDLDQRKVLIHLSLKSKGFREEIITQARRVPTIMTENLSKEEQDMVFVLVGHMITKLQKI
jgi:DNA-binding MarR family transcriptional regulator